LCIEITTTVPYLYQFPILISSLSWENVSNGSSQQREGGNVHGCLGTMSP